MKYLAIEVAKSATTDLFVEVPDDFDEKQFMRGLHRKELGRIARETTNEWEWDDFGWDDSLEIIEVKVVEESEAKQFKIGTLCEAANPVRPE